LIDYGDDPHGEPSLAMSAAAIPLTADNLSLGLMSPLPNTEIDPHAGKTLALSGLSVPDISRREPLSSNFSVKTGSLEPAAMRPYSCGGWFGSEV
jgi:hypothetical protein